MRTLLSADMMEEDEGAVDPAAGPRATAVVTGSRPVSQAGPMTVAQKTSMGLVLRGMFLDSVSASTAQIDEVNHICMELKSKLLLHTSILYLLVAAHHQVES